MSLLEVRTLGVSYGGVLAVTDVDFDVAEGEIVALLGANGAGKTTTLRAISGLVEPHHGTIAVDHLSTHGWHPEKIAQHGVSHVPAGRGIFGSLTVEDNLRMARYAAKRPKGETSEEIFELFPILREKRNVAAGTMSGGQQQQLAIGRALAQKPRLLMVDEMSMGLSPTVVEDLFHIIAGLRTQGIAVLMVEQFVTEALKIADKAVILEQGKVVAAGAPSELAGDQLAAAYLGGGHEPVIAPKRSRADAERLTIDEEGRKARAVRRRADELGVSTAELIARTAEVST